MALGGLMPVPEIQFRKYAEPATEQIHDCGHDAMADSQ